MDCMIHTLVYIIHGMNCIIHRMNLRLQRQQGEGGCCEEKMQEAAQGCWMEGDRKGMDAEVATHEKQETRWLKTHGIATRSYQKAEFVAVLPDGDRLFVFLLFFFWRKMGQNHSCWHFFSYLCTRKERRNARKGFRIAWTNKNTVIIN